MSARISVPEIASRLNVGRLTVYALLERGILPGIRLGHRWIVTRHAYEQWERTCGTPLDAAIQSKDSAPGLALDWVPNRR
jgi:excisionase family DNA binding protein